MPACTAQNCLVVHWAYPVEQGTYKHDNSDDKDE